jgi:hypothetical protein
VTQVVEHLPSKWEVPPVLPPQKKNSFNHWKITTEPFYWGAGRCKLYPVSC